MSENPPALPRPPLLLLLLLAVALAYRLAGLAELEPAGGEAQYYVQWARAFAEGNTLHGGPFLREPLYAWFLGSIMKVFGPGLRAPLLVQCGLGVLSTWLTYRIARRVFAEQASCAPRSLLAALVVAMTAPLVFHDTVISTGALALPLVLLAVERTLIARAAPTLSRLCAAGLLWGVACLAEFQALFLALVATAWLLPVLARSAPMFGPAVLAMTCLAPISTVTAYNRLVAGQWVLLTTEAGVEFWSGNNASSYGSGTNTRWPRRDFWEDHYEALAFAETTSGLPRSESAVSRFYAGEAWSWMRDDPAAALRGLLHKVHLLFLGHPLPRDHTVTSLARRDGAWPCVPLFALLGLGLAGVVLTRRRNGAGLLLAILGVHAVVCTAFVVTSQSRLVLLPLLAIGAGGAGVWIVERVRRRTLLPAFAVTVAVALVAVPSIGLPAEHGVRPAAETPADVAARVDALVEVRPAHAEGIARRALVEHPSSIALRFQLGRALMAQRLFSRARHEFDLVVRANPRSIAGAFALRLCCGVLGDLPAARAAGALAAQSRSGRSSTRLK